MKLRAFSRREKIFVYAVALILAGALSAKGGIIVYNKVGELNQDIKRKEALLARHLYLITKEEDILAAYDKYKDIFAAKIDQEEGDTNLFKEVRALAAKVNLTIEKIKPLPVKARNDYDEFFLEVELGGDLTSIMKFIHQLEGVPAFIHVCGLRIYPQAGAVYPLRCRLILSKLFFH